MIRLFLALLLAPAAHAQLFSAYVISSNTHLSPVRTDFANVVNPQTTSFWASGIGGGVTFRILPLGPFTLGLDLRGSTRPGNDGADTALGGIKLTLTPPAIHLKPYLQLSGGYIGTHTAAVESGHSVSASTFINHYVGYQALAGLDYPIARILDIRLIEIGGGKAYTVSNTANGPFAATNGADRPTLFAINTGLVFQF